MKAISIPERSRCIQEAYFISRDLGARLNNVLTSISLGTGGPSSFGSEFTVRVDLPESESIQYTLNCPNERTKNVTREWFITFSGLTDGPFYEFNCKSLSSRSSSPLNLKKLKDSKKSKIVPYIFNPKVKEILTNKNLKSVNPNELSKATLVYDAESAKFYKSIDSDFGIVVLINELGDINEILTGFKTLAAEPTVKRLVIDISNNPGGSINQAQFLDALLVPSNFTPFPRDMNVQSDVVKAIIRTSYVRRENPFDPTFFINFETGKQFGSVDEFIGSKQIIRGGKRSYYSTNFLDETFLPSLFKLPWNTTNMIVLSNGASGSAAAMISQYLQEIGNVSTVSVGGFVHQDLSFASFPGGLVYDSYDLAFALYGKLVKQFFTSV
ncbi:29903_t:CDS:2 [Racocetra persica]|uniref:29903_t:CDS:1 n=1 Tax=Racocetra persica TaxID=160502 RepID=A0ACA9PXY9_9GLOM|nr:29903_t:CDS:2 [Racocetra persica]